MSHKIVICCQVQLFAEGLWCLLEKSEEVKVLGVARDDNMIETLLQYSPDVIITDLTCSRVVLEKNVHIGDKKVLMINDGVNLDSNTIKEMINEGLGGLLPPDADGDMLLKAIRKLHEGELWFDRHTVQEVLSQKKRDSQRINLTKKEKEILSHICSGMTNREIAKKLYISEQTVKSHCNHLFKKFGVSSRLKLALSAPKHFAENMNRMH